jgi:signal transduction histidine kinase/CheY-like chemotaxis protein
VRATTANPGRSASRAAAVLEELQQRVWRRTDRMFGYLMVAQWVSAVALALVTSPFTWDGAERSVHPHVYAAIVLGGLISALPLALIRLQPGAALTRVVVAIAQMLWSALLIHLTGGRIETHFHVFGSLAFIAFYRDWRLLLPATVVVALDHFLRGLFWPESVYGVANPEAWRFAEHAFWVAFEGIFLFTACRQGVRELEAVADRQVEVEQLSAQLEEKRALLASQSDASLEGVLVVSPGGKALFANRRFSEIWGFGSAPVESARDSDLLAAAVERLEDPAAFLERVKYMMAHADEEATDELRFRDGRTVERYTVPVRTARGETIGRGWYFRDITARVRAEADVRALNAELEHRVAERTAALSEANGELQARLAELRQTRDQLVQADRLASMGRLAAGVGHEINNPLTYIMSNVQEIADLGDSAPHVAQLAVESLEGLERVRRIVSDLKMMARVGDEERTPLELHGVLEPVIRMAAMQVRNRARLVRAYGDLPPVLGDGHRLGQVFLNLIVNAAQALTVEREGGHEIRIETGTDAGGRAFVEVSDTGEGIPATHLPRLFDAFYTTKAIGVGTGLGLSICHAIVLAHGGSIEVESTIGVGSRFRVVLPAAAAADAPVASRPGRRTSGAVGVAEPARRRILVVDDEPKVLAAIRRSLCRRHDVDVVGDGRRALDLLAVASYDVILCDLMMPQITGMELHDTLAVRFPEQAQRMVFLTGGAFTAPARDFLSTTTNKRLEKPFDLKELKRLVNGLVR